VGLTAKRDRPVPAGAGLDIDACAILEHDRMMAAARARGGGR
jgi:hypothetical protein